MVIKEELVVWVIKGPEQNGGVLITGSASVEMSWVNGSGPVREVGRMFPHKHIIANRDDSRIPDSEYGAHRELAESVFSSRVVRKERKEKALSAQARMFV